jgi:hypothetical protein
MAHSGRVYLHNVPLDQIGQDAFRCAMSFPEHYYSRTPQVSYPYHNISNLKRLSLFYQTTLFTTISEPEHQILYVIS